jgi:large subunit ribosomal protein L9e
MGKTILVQEDVVVPEGVTVEMSKGYITVKGKQGTLKKLLPKAPVLYRTVEEKKKKTIQIKMFLANRKRQSCVTSLAKFVKNMIKGVTVGYEYKLRFGFNILPQRPQAAKDGKSFEISNFMGQKDVHKIPCPAGVTVRNHEDPKVKEVFVSGIDVNTVGHMSN